MARTKKDSDRRGVNDFDIKIKKRKNKSQKIIKNQIYDELTDSELSDFLKR